MAGFKHVLVPTDFGEASNEALNLALGLAAAFESKVTLLHVTLFQPYYYLAYAEGVAWPAGELEIRAKMELDAAVGNAKQRWAKIEAALVGGEPWTEILNAAKERGADLIVMGTHGRRGLSRVFLGSVAEKVVRLSPVPVMTVSTKSERQAKEEALADTPTAKT
jgi:nucleotide-binding universal stress UspA family protein